MPANVSVPADDDGDDEGWEDMPIIRFDSDLAPFDEEDQKRFHYAPPSSHPSKSLLSSGAGNATGNLIDYDAHGNEWRSKLDLNESEYTRLRLNDDDSTDDVHLRTQYLFDQDQAMTPLSQMQATKKLLTEAQRMAYVGLCFLTCRQMSSALSSCPPKEVKDAIQSLDLWSLKIMGRLYYHMELLTPEQKMIESLSQHDVRPRDLVPSLMTTHTVANPEYDPTQVRQQEKEMSAVSDDNDSTLVQQIDVPPPTPQTTALLTPPTVLQPTTPISMPGVSTSLSSTDKEVTLDIRWTVLCDLFLLIVADSVYDARSRVLLETVAAHLGLGWLDVVKFEKRVTDALEIQESVEKLEQQDVIQGRAKAAKRKRIVMMGLATLGGGLVIGLSAGLLAPVIGAGLGAALTTVGVTGTSGFLAGAGGAAMITTGGVLTGSSIAGRGMARRTRQVGTFDLLPLHNHKRVNCILTVPGFMKGPQDDVRLPFSVLDPIVGDVFSILWEPEMMGETGNALKILTTEVVTQLGQTVLQATVMTALMSALQWPLLLTKLGYLIDNPWSNALDRAKAAGGVLAEVLIQRSLGVRPITLIGFSLGARVIFYCLLELAKKKAFGIVQDVFLLGTTVTASTKTWIQARSAASGRFVNGYAKNDWILNYLFRASSGGLNAVAGLRPIENVPGVENVDVTDKISGHMSYRVYMPVILDQLGFPVTADYFDEPEEFEMEDEQMAVRAETESTKSNRFSLFGHKQSATTTSPSRRISRPPSYNPVLPRKHFPHEVENHSSETTVPRTSDAPVHAGFDFEAIHNVIDTEISGIHPPTVLTVDSTAGRPPPPINRSESTPLPVAGPDEATLSFTESNGNDPDLANHDSARAVFTRPRAQSLENRDIFNTTESLATRPWGSDLNQTERPEPSPSISFGGSDGSIWNNSMLSNQQLNGNEDWIPRPIGTRKTGLPTPAPNPWQT